MDTKNLKSISVAAIIAIVAGVFMMSANQAFGGIEVPSQEPATAGLVSPTFGGLDVKGVLKSIKLSTSGDATIGGVAKISSVSATSISTGTLDVKQRITNGDSTGHIVLDGNVDIYQQLTNPSANNAGALSIADDVNISGILDIWNEITNSKTTGSGTSTVQYPVKINDKLEVTDSISNPNTTDNTAVKIDDELVVTGPIKNPTGDGVIIKDDVFIQPWGECKEGEVGCVYAYGSSAYNSNLSVSGNANVLGKVNVSKGVTNTLDKLLLDDDVNINGNLYMGDYNNRKAIGVYGSVVIGETAICKPNEDCGYPEGGADGHNGNLDVKGTISSYYVATKNIKATGDLTLSGVAKAKRFGTYTRFSSSFLPIPSNNIAEASKACPTGSYLVSCGGQGSDSSTFSPTKDVSFTNLDPKISTNTCYARGLNRSTTTKYIAAIAVCLDPAN